jgi:very-short-patch-repair endonuclease
VRIHKVIRRQPAEVLAAGIPRVRPAVAAIRAAGWAVSDQQAALLLVMPIQQGLVMPGHLVEACGLVLGRRRRSFIKGVVGDICLGVQALGELDFARMCRSRGLPEPTRQVTRRGLAGRAYLDVYWDDHDLAVEIDGSQHRQGLAVTRDNLRTNDVVLAGDRLLRIDLLGLRLEADLFFAQVAAALGLPRPVRGNSSLHAAT